MKVALANLGGLTYAIKASLEFLGLEPVVPDRNNFTMHAITAGLMPIEMCFPLKVLLGNYLSRIDEKADAVICYSGFDMCNLNPVNYTFQQIFNDLNWYPEIHLCNVNSRKDFIYSYFTMLGKLSDKSLFHIGRSISLGIRVYELCSYIDQVFYTVRPAFDSFVQSEELYNNLLDKLFNVNNSKDLKLLKQDVSFIYSNFKDKLPEDCLKIGLVGDTFSLAEPYIHNFTDKELGKNGVMVDKWLNHKLLDAGKKNDLPENILKSQIIGSVYQNKYGVMTDFELNKMKKFVSNSYDGMVFISSLSCNPNDAIKNMLKSLETSLEMPILTMVFDEHISNVGNSDRIEAFVELLKARRRNKLAKNLCYS